MRELNGGIAKISLLDIKTILARVSDIKDNDSVAAITLDYLLRQSVGVTTRSDGHALCSLITNYICTSFGLDKAQTGMLKKMAGHYYQYTQHQAIKYGIVKHSEPHDAGNCTFQQYYTQFIQRHQHP